MSDATFLYGLADDEYLDGDPISACDRIGDELRPGATFELCEWLTRGPNVVAAPNFVLEMLLSAIYEHPDMDDDLYDQIQESFACDDARAVAARFAAEMTDVIQRAGSGWRWANRLNRVATVTVPEAWKRWDVQWRPAGDEC